MTIHVLIVSYPVQGQINPLLRLGKRIASTGSFLVTFVTTAYFGRQVTHSTGITAGHFTPVGAGFVQFEFFEDEWDDNDPRRRDSHLFFPHLEIIGRKHISQMLRRFSDEGRPVCCLVNSTLTPWAADVGAKFGIPQAFMWTQSCASFLTFYSYCRKLTAFPTESDPFTDVNIPTLPLLKWDEFHTYLHPLNPLPRRKSEWLAEFGILDKFFCVLIDTFDELEHSTLEFASNLCPIIKPVGPLFKSAMNFDFSGDRLKADLDCLPWLDTKPRRSVIYISFGPMVVLKQEQVDEIAHGISNLGLSFLWVMKPGQRGLVENGMVVEYSPQERVLAHPSVECFMTHCGWNSMMEALTSGVPMVVFPQWGDQVTTTKIVVDVLGVGVRMGRGEHEEKVVPHEEVRRCVMEATVGPKADDMRRKVVAWKNKAEKAYQEGGTSDKCLQGFVDEIKRRSNVHDVVANYST